VTPLPVFLIVVDFLVTVFLAVLVAAFFLLAVCFFTAFLSSFYLFLNKVAGRYDLSSLLSLLYLSSASITALIRADLVLAIIYVNIKLRPVTRTYSYA
jgi:hypothetical protein